MLPGVILNTRDYRGRDYADFHARKDSGVKGWVLFGRGADYGGRLIMLCARPDVPAYRYGGRVIRRGWRTKAEASRVAAVLNLL